MLQTPPPLGPATTEAIRSLIQVLTDAARELKELNLGIDGRSETQLAVLRNWSGPHADRFRQRSHTEAELFAAEQAALETEIQQWTQFLYSYS